MQGQRVTRLRALDVERSADRVEVRELADPRRQVGHRADLAAEAVLGVDPQDVAWAQPRLRPQPYLTFAQPLKLRGGTPKMPRVYIRCTAPAYANFEPFAQRFRNDDRLLKTLILSALAPEVEALHALTSSRLAALNHGTVRSPIPGQENQIVLQRCRKWAAQVGEIKISDDDVWPLPKGTSARARCVSYGTCPAGSRRDCTSCG